MKELPSLQRGAVIGLAGIGLRDVENDDLRRWLAQGDVYRESGPRDILPRVAAALGEAAPEAGQGALRYWGQTSTPPKGWLAAADPVYFEPRLDHLGLYSLPADDSQAADVDLLFSELQQTLGDHYGLQFRSLDGFGYLFSDRPVDAAADLSAAALDGFEPSAYMPEGPAAKAYQRLQSEIQMVLHQSEVQERRQGRGLRPINGLWIWGAGDTPAVEAAELPPLYGDDPLLKGFWYSRGASAGDLGRSLEDAVTDARSRFVAMPSARSIAASGGVEPLLNEMRSLLGRGSVRSLMLLFADGVTVVRSRRHGLRVWRKSCGLSGDRRAGP